MRISHNTSGWYDTETNGSNSGPPVPGRPMQAGSSSPSFGWIGQRAGRPGAKAPPPIRARKEKGNEDESSNKKFAHSPDPAGRPAIGQRAGFADRRAGHDYTNYFFLGGEWPG